MLTAFRELAGWSCRMLICGAGIFEPPLRKTTLSNLNQITGVVREARAVFGYRPMPILFHEDDHFNLGQDKFNMQAAISGHSPPASESKSG